MNTKTVTFTKLHSDDLQDCVYTYRCMVCFLSQKLMFIYELIVHLYPESIADGCEYFSKHTYTSIDV